MKALTGELYITGIGSPQEKVNHQSLGPTSRPSVSIGELVVIIVCSDLNFDTVVVLAVTIALAKLRMKGPALFPLCVPYLWQQLTSNPLKASARGFGHPVMSPGYPS